MQKNILVSVIITSLIVAIIASIATLAMTGNIVSDKGIVPLARKGQCEYIGYKDVSPKGIPYSGMNVSAVCKTLKMTPKLLVNSKDFRLSNARDCSPSYSILDSEGDIIHSYDEKYANAKLGEVENSCYNAEFPDGTPNNNFSTQLTSIGAGVLCCK